MSGRTAKCYRSGCKERTDRLYCTKHRCTSEDCESSTQSGRKHCAEHIPCAKRHCREARYGPAASDSEATDGFCDEHYWTCLETDCFNDVSNTSQISPYCENYRCGAANCVARLRGDTSKAPVDSPYCAHHRCYITGCDEAGANWQASYYYCSNHACQVAGCAGNRDSKARSVFCFNHRCSVSSCNEAGADYQARRHCCQTHACHYDGCSNISVYTKTRYYSKFCIDHYCKAPSCNEPRDLKAGREYCESHIFSADEYSWYWKEDFTYAYCKQHCCAALDCYGPNEAENGRTYCSLHEVCGKNDCTGSRLQTEMMYCTKHQGSCALKHCFRDQVGGSQLHCSRHGCPAHSCWLPLEKKRKFCENHDICGAPECAAVCELPDKACNGEHACRRRRCRKAICSRETEYCTDGE